MVSLIVDDMPVVPVARAAVHQLQAPRVTRITVIALLTRLDLTARLPELTWDRSLGWLTAGDEQARVAMNTMSGGLRFSLRPLADEQGNVTTPAARLEEVARAFLSQFGRPTEPLALERITHLREQAVSVTGEVSEVTTLDAGLIFRRSVDDLPVIGPGGFVMVRIGPDEKVVGGREVWRPVAERGPVLDLRGPDQAIELLRQHLESLGFEGEVQVRQSFFGYEERGIDELQRRLEPAYAFKVVIPRDGIDYKTVVVLSALQPAVA